MLVTRRVAKRRAVAGILSAIILFVMLFTVGTGYFLVVNQGNQLYTQAFSNREGSIQNSLSDSLGLSTSLAPNGDVAVAAVNTGVEATTIEGIFVASPTGSVQYVSSGAKPALPLAVDAGVSSAPIDTSVQYAGGSYFLKILTQSGATFSATYPPTATALAAQALSSGAIGDLYLTFTSYSFYTITSSGCPNGQGYSSYCLQTAQGDTGPAFAISTSTYSSSLMAFSIVLTDLNSNQEDIVLDQFTLMYQNSFYGNEHEDLNPWYVVTTGTQSGGLIPIMNNFQPIVLHYDVPTTVTFAAQSCVTASTGPNYNNCSGNTVNKNQLQYCPCPYGGTLSNVFILTNGWELPAGSYQVSNLKYSGLNYGQNTPFVSTLYY